MVTPLIEVLPNLFLKYEMNNSGGSHKVRAAKYIIEAAIDRGEVIPKETTVIEKTGGNFGIGLLYVCKKYDIDVDLAVGLSFSLKKRNFLERMGANLIGKDMLNDGDSPNDVVQYHLNNADKLGKKYYFTDQFNNIDSVNGHIFSTGPEIVNQLVNANCENSDIWFISCAGTGASLMGIRHALIKQGFNVKTCLVEPEGCFSQSDTFIDHRFEGMSVGVTPPFIEWNAIDCHYSVTHEEMINTQISFSKEQGHLVGNTSAACIWVAKEFNRKYPKKKILTILYDHGLWYEDFLE